MEYIKRIGKFILGSIILLVFGFLMLFTSIGVYAASIDEETVLNDLKRDPNFDVETYPDDENDYSIQVIQLAESKENELVVYVYQPADKTIDLPGTKISISYGFSQDGKNLKPKLYDLELLSTNGVFDKYLIKDFPVPGDTQRYYNIVSIFRKYNNAIDDDTTVLLSTGGEFSDKSYPVGQQWYIYDINDSKGYEMATFNTMLVDTNFVGNFYFADGYTVGTIFGCPSSCDVWIFCFNAPAYKIDHIYDGDLTYDIRKVKETQQYWDVSHSYGEWENKTITLTDQDIMTYDGPGLGSRKYQWHRILSSSDFLKSANDHRVTINDDAKAKINESQWVFTFAETSRSSYESAQVSIRDYYDIDNVGLLRLDFMDTSGHRYDLGVVNSLFNPDNKADGYGYNDIKDLFKDLGDFFEKLFMIIGIVILVLLVIALTNLFPPLGAFIKLIVKAIVLVISLPFKIFKWVFKRK